MGLTLAQLEARRHGIGSSDIGTVAGLCPWASPIECWEVKRGLRTVEETRAMKMGTVLEPVIANLYAEEALSAGESLTFPETVWPSIDGTLRHTTEAWILASPDRVVVRDGAPVRLVEIKTASGRNAHHFGGDYDAIPDHYRAQIEWQMLVTGVERADLAVLIAGEEFRVYRGIERDPVMADALVTIGRAFWRSVLDGEAPPVDGSEGYADYLARRFPRASTEERVATEAMDAYGEELGRVKGEIAVLEAREKLLSNALRLAIGDADAIVGTGWRATWRAPAGGVVSWKDVATVLGADSRPEVVAAHTKAPSRRFVYTKGK